MIRPSQRWKPSYASGASWESQFFLKTNLLLVVVIIQIVLGKN